MGTLRPTLAALTAVSPAVTLRAHRDSGFGLRELRIYQPWQPGPSAGSPDPHLLSVNEYRPHLLRDVAPIARISAELARQMLELSLIHI